MKRSTRVKGIRVISVVNASVVTVGDAHTLKPKSNIIAVQREGGVQSDEGYSFKNYSIFSKAMPSQPIAPIYQKKRNHCQNISVATIDITGVTTSSTVQLGNVANINTEARLKHIRILQDEQVNQTGTNKISR